MYICSLISGMAMMTGQGTIVTYDKRVFTISEAGTFLLSKDYNQNNLTVLMQSNQQGRYDLVALTKRHLVHIDLYRQVCLKENILIKRFICNVYGVCLFADMCLLVLILPYIWYKFLFIRISLWYKTLYRQIIKKIFNTNCL